MRITTVIVVALLLLASNLLAADVGQLQRTLSGHKGYVLSVAFSPDGKRIVSGSADRTIRIWDSNTGKLQRTIGGQTHEIESVAFSPDGKEIVSGSADATVKIWDAETGLVSKTLVGHKYRVTSAIYSGNGKVIASTSSRFTPLGIMFHNAKTGKLLGNLQLIPRTVCVESSLSFSSDSKLIACTCRENIHVFDTNTSRQIGIITGHANIVKSVAFIPDDQPLIVSGSYDHTIKVWNIKNGEHWTGSGHTAHVLSVAFSPDGKRIISGSDDKTIKIWNTKPDEVLKTLAGHGKAVYSVAFSPDGKRIISGSGDKTIKIWDASEQVK